MRVIKKFEMRKLKHACGVVAQNFLLNYILFKITLNPSKKVEFSSEKQKLLSVDGTIFKHLFIHFARLSLLLSCPASTAGERHW